MAEGPAGGIIEKVLPEKVPLSLLMRVVLPGVAAAFALYRVTPLQDKSLAGLIEEKQWAALLLVALVIYALGALIAAFIGQIFKIYEGLLFWPPRLHAWGVAKQQRRVLKLLAAQKTAKGAQFEKLWYSLRLYPLNDKKLPYASQPTLLGNILAGYEQYPIDRYGMDSVFYWPRLWLKVDKDTKEEIDSNWSVAEGFLSLSGVSYGAGLIWLVTSFSLDFGISWLRLPVKNFDTSFWLAIGWLLAGYLFYRISLPFHRANGEVFKSVFDLYRKELSDLARFRLPEKAQWQALFYYLQYSDEELLSRLPEPPPLEKK
jgi:hypothetical protein